MRGTAGRSGRGYMEAINRQRERQFYEMLKVGKEQERRIDIALTSLGFHVLDISNRRMANGKHLPFDLLALASNRSIIIQVKSTTQISLGYDVYTKELEQWENFSINAEKLLVIATPKGDSYIRVSDIRQVAKPSGRTRYSIFYNDTKSLRGIIDYNI